MASRERTLLDWLCEHLPRDITPNQLTWIGVFGAMLVFAGYIGSRYNPVFLWLATLGYLLNWFGDSLDGSLARYRGIERPRYGYFLDCSADAIAIVLIMTGLGLSGYVRLDAALFALLGYFMLCIFVFLCNHVTGRHHITFLSLGPTELRIGLIALNGLMYFNCSANFSFAGEHVSSFDIILFADGLITIFIAVFNMLKVIKELEIVEPGVAFKCEEASAADAIGSAPFSARLSRIDLDQSFLKNASIFAKYASQSDTDCISTRPSALPAAE